MEDETMGMSLAAILRAQPDPQWQAEQRAREEAYEKQQAERFAAELRTTALQFALAAQHGATERTEDTIAAAAKFEAFLAGIPI